MFCEQPANQPNQPIVVHMALEDQLIDWLLAGWFDLTEPVLEALEVSLSQVTYLIYFDMFCKWKEQ